MIRIRVVQLKQLIWYFVVTVLAVIVLGLIINLASSFLGGGKATPTPAPTISPTPVSQVQMQAQTTEGAALPLPSVADNPSSSSGALPLAPGESPADSASPQPSSGASPVPSPSAAPDLRAPIKKLFTDLLYCLTGTDLSDPQAVMAYAMPGIVTGEPKVIAALTPYAHEGEDGEPTVEEPLPEDIQIEIERINQQTPEQVLPEGKLKVLIYHTHNTEAYTPDEAYPYSSDDAYRTADNHYNIVAVGEKLTELLTEEGLEVFHDTRDHERPKLRTAYTRSIKTVQEYLDKYPDITLTIDLHRDAYIEGQDQVIVGSDGTRYAQVMMVVGTGEGFDEKPNWQQNYQLARAVTSALNDLQPGVGKEPMVRTDRFNQHMAPYCLLIEVGNERNTLTEVMNTVGLLSQALAKATATP
ncbi:MAG: stage II sporulation protein P [Christensenellales bacterium]|jgi:stage II sporulation protein P